MKRSEFFNGENGMSIYLIKRILFMIPLLLGITIICFL